VNILSILPAAITISHFTRYDGAHKQLLQFDDGIFLPTQLVKSWTPFFKHVSGVVQKHRSSGCWDTSPKSALYL
jgi:hypothetical protein